MSVSYIPERIKLQLWGKAAGRCEYEGCNQALWLDALTKVEFNSAYVAHIIADCPDGPRGDPVLSEQLKRDPSNLMLICDVHHRLIDHEDIAGHSAERLRNMKASHEARIELLSGIGPDKQSHVLLYGANIGVHSSNISLAKAAEAMVPDSYPAESRAIELGFANSSFTDRDQEFWKLEAMHLRRLITQQVRSRLSNGLIHHLSIFALAPQPLLALLGYLLSDIPAAEVYQLHREPPNWKWREPSEADEFVFEEPETIAGEPALIIALSATINESRVEAALENPTIWKLLHPKPQNDILQSKEQARAFRSAVRRLMDRIKARHGQGATIHVFPAMPVALAVDLGRVIMPKADLPIWLYDENRSRGGFSKAVELTPALLAPV
jgi:CBASS immunity sensor of nucleotide second messenger signals